MQRMANPPPDGTTRRSGADGPDGTAPRRRPGATWLAAGTLWLIAILLFAAAPFARGAADGAAEPALPSVAEASAHVAEGASGPGRGDAAGLAASETSADSDGVPSDLSGPLARDAVAAANLPAPKATARSVAPTDRELPASAQSSEPTDPPATETRAEPTQPPEPTDPTATETPAEPTQPPEPTVPPATETLAPPPLSAEFPVLPVIDAALFARLQAIWADGQARGRRGDVLAKVGDSLTVSGFFLTGVGCDTSRLGDREDLRPLIDLYRAAVVPEGASVAPCAAANSLTRRSVSAEVGWLTSQVFGRPRGELPPECAPPEDSALRCEVALIQPSIAIVTLGTNDVHINSGPARYAASLGRVVDELAGLGVIPLLSTLPPRTDRAVMAERTDRYNDVVLAVARDHQVPLVNLWRDLQVDGLARQGMEPDGVHLNAVGYGASFTAGGLRYGQNRRNLLVLDAVAKVRRVVIEGGAPDG